MSGTGAAIVYVLCLVTSVICAGLLVRAWLRTRTRFLMWCALAFSFLALNNLFLVIDMILIEDIDFWMARQGTALAAVAVLLYAFVWEMD